MRTVLPSRHAGLLPRKDNRLLDRTRQVVALNLDGLDSLGIAFKYQDYLIIADAGVESSPQSTVENFFVRFPTRIRLA